MGGMDSKQVRFTFETPITEVPSAFAGLQASVEDGKLLVSYQPSRAQMSDILTRIQSAALAIRDISTKEVELEDLFLNLTRDKAA